MDKRALRTSILIACAALSLSACNAVAVFQDPDNPGQNLVLNEHTCGALSTSQNEDIRTHIIRTATGTYKIISTPTSTTVQEVKN